jgi:mannose-6-phosphate isomerase-like protein (cupin superfamily)
MDRGIFLESGEGRAVTARGSRMVFKAMHEATQGLFSFMERELPVSNRRPQPHRHEGPEGFYVLDGAIEFVVGAESRIGGPGFWALAPRGVAHTFGNAGNSPARLLIIHAPAADRYFVELDALWSRAAPPTPEEERALMKRHGLEPVVPD